MTSFRLGYLGLCNSRGNGNAAHNVSLWKCVFNLFAGNGGGEDSTINKTRDWSTTIVLCRKKRWHLSQCAYAKKDAKKKHKKPSTQLCPNEVPSFKKTFVFSCSMNRWQLRGVRPCAQFWFLGHDLLRYSRQMSQKGLKGIFLFLLLLFLLTSKEPVSHHTADTNYYIKVSVAASSSRSSGLFSAVRSWWLAGDYKVPTVHNSRQSGALTRVAIHFLQIF